MPRLKKYGDTLHAIVNVRCFFYGSGMYPNSAKWIPVRALIDTAASHTVVPEFLLNHYSQLNDRSVNINKVSVTAALGVQETKEVDIKLCFASIRFGRNVYLEEKRFIVSDCDIMLIGMDILQHFSISICGISKRWIISQLSEKISGLPRLNYEG